MTAAAATKSVLNEEKGGMDQPLQMKLKEEEEEEEGMITLSEDRITPDGRNRGRRGFK